MEIITKQPSEKITYEIDFTSKLPEGAATVSSSALSAINYATGASATDIVLVSDTGTIEDNLKVLFTVQAGSDEQDYKITALTTLNNGNILEQDILLRVREE